MWPQRFPVSGSRFTTTVGCPNKHACEEACLPPPSSSLWVLHPCQLWETPKGHWGSPARTRSGSVWTLNVLPAPCVAWLVSDSLPLVCARTSFTEVERIVLEFRWVLFWMYIVTWERCLHSIEISFQKSAMCLSFYGNRFLSSPEVLEFSGVYTLHVFS